MWKTCTNPYVRLKSSACWGLKAAFSQPESRHPPQLWSGIQKCFEVPLCPAPLLKPLWNNYYVVILEGNRNFPLYCLLNEPYNFFPCLLVTLFNSLPVKMCWWRAGRQSVSGRRNYHPVSCQRPDTCLRFSAMQGWVQPICQPEEQPGMSGHCLPACSVKSLVWGLPWFSPVLICTACWRWVLRAFTFLFLLERTQWSCKLDLESSVTLQYSSLWLLNCRIREAFNSFMPFSAVEWVPLSYQFIHL